MKEWVTCPGPAGAGVVILALDILQHCESRWLGVATNNIAELEALDMSILHALNECHHIPPDRRRPIHFFIDNAYALNTVQQKWKAKCNRRLIKRVSDNLKFLNTLTTTILT